MFGIGFFELVVIAIVAIIFVGPERLPEFMRKAGRLFVQARRISNEVKSTFNQAIYDVEEEIRKEKAEVLKKLLEEHRQKEETNSLTEKAMDPATPQGAEPMDPHLTSDSDLPQKPTEQKTEL